MAIYEVKNRWGASSAPWYPAGNFVIGFRVNQRCIALAINSNDGGTSMAKNMTYTGEGPIDVKAVEPTQNRTIRYGFRNSEAISFSKKTYIV